MPLQCESLKKENLSSQIIDECLAIDLACFEKGVAFAKDNLSAYFKNSNVLLAKLNGKIIGYLIYYQKKDGKNYHVACLAINPTFQNLHIGSFLLNVLSTLANKRLVGISLDCRPYNEPFYRKLGFKAVCLPKIQNGIINDDYYHLNYYRYADIKVHSIFMRKEANASTPNNKTSTSKHWIEPGQNEYEIYRKQLLELTIAVKASTNIFYKGFFGRLLHRTERKEKAFEAIINELKALGHDETKPRKLNPTAVLQTIAHNAMINRGFGLTKTSSGRKLIQLLNKEKFKDLKQLLDKSNKKISYANTKEFSGIMENEKSKFTPKPYSPYWHF